MYQTAAAEEGARCFRRPRAASGEGRRRSKRAARDHGPGRTRRRACLPWVEAGCTSRPVNCKRTARARSAGGWRPCNRSSWWDRPSACPGQAEGLSHQCLTHHVVTGRVFREANHAIGDLARRLAVPREPLFRRAWLLPGRSRGDWIAKALVRRSLAARLRSGPGKAATFPPRPPR